jgi:hypothetical protein
MSDKIKHRQQATARLPRNSQVAGMLATKKGGPMRDRRERRKGERKGMKFLLEDNDR